ncbi:MAG: YggS family pyridoxal phosphate-dependent enzyme [Clostridiales bacterium]|nr:YggS family pyridoxal phosphate-dependent enzyme [Clostridiales bacterium]
MTIKENYLSIYENVDKICSSCGRNINDVKIIAVTKTRTVDEINQVIDAGAQIIGENRVQELLHKYDYINEKAEKHLIGQLQTNKVKAIIDKVDCIHSLDRISLAQQIENIAQIRNLTPVKVLVEVNIGYEITKSGILPDNLTEYLDILKNFRYIKPIGLMTVAPMDANVKEQNLYFEKMFNLLEIGKKHFGSSFCELSMGMSRDYETAIKHGATMIRLGTALFGERNCNI